MKRKGDVPFWGSLEVNPRPPVPPGEKGTPPMLELITARATGEPEGAVRGTLDELAREGAQRMIEAALQLEVEEYVTRHRSERDAAGHAVVVRNGTARPRRVTTGVGPIPVAAPRVNDRRVVDGQRQQFTSAILPPYVRRSPRVESVLPLLYLHGLSSGDFREALPALLGPEAAGLSPSTILRLTKSWTAEYEAFRRRDLADRDYVYLWADGIHFTIRLEEERLCTLVLIGVRPDGTQGSGRPGGRLPGERRELAHGAAGSQAPRHARPGAGDRRWRARLLGRGAGGVAGDGRAAVLGAPDRQRPGQAAQGAAAAGQAGVARDAVRRDARRLRARDPRFTAEYGAKYPKAVASLTIDQDRLLTLFDYPAEHWKHLRTTNPIESTFATVRLRERVTKGAGSRTAGLTMAFKLLEAAQGHWRRRQCRTDRPLVRAGVRFEDGVRVERQERKKGAA